MYEHYELFEDVFVDREEFIEWMNKALFRCNKKSIVLHLKGIGGIGKSSLLNSCCCLSKMRMCTQSNSKV